MVIVNRLYLLYMIVKEIVDLRSVDCTRKKGALLTTEVEVPRSSGYQYMATIRSTW